MKVQRQLLTIIGLVAIAATAAYGQSNRTWVSPSGDDANNCTVNKPCKTFAGALAKTNAGGEIVVQESGGFGPVTIDKSITIDGGGKYAGIQVSGSGNNAVTIQATSSDVVVLRGLTLNGLGVGSKGINASASVGALHVENCVISDFTGVGIDPHGTPAVFVKDTVIRECGTGIYMVWSGAKALIERCRLENNATGLYLLVGPQVTVSETVASGNTNYGFEVDWGDLNIESCVVSNNGTGIYSTVVPSPNGPSTVTVSKSIVTNNLNYGFRQSGTSVFYSRGNNTVRGNGTDTSGTITPLAGT